MLSSNFIDIGNSVLLHRDNILYARIIPVNRTLLWKLQIDVKRHGKGWLTGRDKVYRDRIILTYLTKDEAQSVYNKLAKKINAEIDSVFLTACSKARS